MKKDWAFKAHFQLKPFCDKKDFLATFLKLLPDGSIFAVLQPGCKSVDAKYAAWASKWRLEHSF